MTKQNQKRVISLVAVGLFPAALMIWFRFHQASEFASLELILYPLLFGSIGISVIYLLKRFYLGESLATLNSGEGRIATDVAWGLALTAVYFGLFLLAQMTLRDLLAFRPNQELLGLMLDMREHWWMVIVWFGPVLWIGIALFEELLRAFLLTGLWAISANRIWVFVAILMVAALVGLTHWSQGPYGVVTIGLKSLVIGAFYFRYRRLLPLVLAHVLYDGIQVGALLLTYPGN